MHPTKICVMCLLFLSDVNHDFHVPVDFSRNPEYEI
jgi:hypothetical protein